MFVNFLAEREQLDALESVRNDRRCAAIHEECPQPLAIVSLVRQQFLRGGQLGNERFCDDTIINVTPCEQERYRSAFAVRKRMDFGRAATSADAERLPPFLPCAARWALIAVESMLFS